MPNQSVIFRDLGSMDYKSAWDYQESLLQDNVHVKMALRSREMDVARPGWVDSDDALAAMSREYEKSNADLATPTSLPTTHHYLLFVEHPPVFTLGKSGNINNVLLSEERLKEKGIEFYHTNRGGDITFHGPKQIVGYPILDLEKFDTDIGHYLRNLEELVILTLADYGITGERSTGETGVWIDAGIKGRERKICAIGVRCSRWITMHGFALNVNTDLGYFNHIIPCGIQNKQVTSLQKELGREVDLEDAKERVRQNFERVFNVKLVNMETGAVPGFPVIAPGR